MITFGMFSRAGDKKVGEAVESYRSHHSCAQLAADIQEIAKTYPEVHDTAVEDEVVYAIREIDKTTGPPVTLTIHIGAEIIVSGVKAKNEAAALTLAAKIADEFESHVTEEMGFAKDAELDVPDVKLVIGPVIRFRRM